MTARSLILCACCLAVAPAAAWCCDPEDTFDLAEYVPADVTTFVSIIDGAAVRSELASHPMGKWLTTWTLSPDLVDAWEALAESARVSGTELFDTAFGASCTFVVRGRGASAEWAIISKVEPEDANRLLHTLRPRLIDYWQRMPIFDLPEHQLLVSRHENLLLVGPRAKGQRALFETVCRGVVDDIESRLEDDEAFEQAIELGGGALFVFVRHEDSGLMRGGPGQHGIRLASHQHGERVEHERHWTAFSGSLHGSDLSIRHVSSKPIVQLGTLDHVKAWDMAPLAALGEQNVLALIKPGENRDGLIERVVQEKLGSVDVLALVREQHAGRRILVVDDPEGATTSVTVAQAVELGCDEENISNLKSMLQGVNISIRNLDRGAYLVPSGSLTPVYVASHSFEDYAQDEVAAVFRGLPVMEPMPLKWTVAEGPTANWCVMSNDHETMVAMAKALAAQPDESPALGTWVSCGAGDGRRLADTLRKLASPDGAAHSISGLAMDKSLKQLTSIAGVVEQFCWTLARNDEGRLTLDVRLKLATSPGRSR